ncbi:hypothetical protein ACJIZ3_005524 [Penstemon smallii]|uniref:COMM domain-containing protein n=1 Tax=Penstemon smallii TaxID=265156 RepID=A0ABD3S544_9LAMI
MVVEEDNNTLYQQLHKLVGINSEQELENVLELLWQSRKTGLSSPQKSSLQSLLKLPSPGDLDPVLASLRSLLRNCVRKSLDGEDILKLLPHDLPLELQSMLLVLLQKHQNQWKRDMSQEQPLTGRNAGLSVPLSSEVSGSILPPQVSVPHFSSCNFGGPAPIAVESNGSFSPHLTLQNDVLPPDMLGVLPRVKSMTWSVENKSETPADRVAIITLKLQDYTKSPSKDVELKFQLTKDTLEAVLRSMTYINEQLSRFQVGSSSVPLQKKRRQ